MQLSLIKDGISIENYINELIVKVKIASTANLSQWKKHSSGVVSKIEPNWSNKVIAIGASTGGTEAILTILRALPRNMPGIVIVQHMPPVFTKIYAQRLNNLVALNVKEAQTGDIVQQGSVLIAPGDKHMKIEKLGSTYRVVCYEGEKVNGHCPSVDVLFNSVAKKVGKDAIGVILTGMGYDGAKGLLSMKRSGAKTIGQDEKSSVIYGMPRVAFNLGAVDKQVSLDSIPQVICSFLDEG